MISCLIFGFLWLLLAMVAYNKNFKKDYLVFLIISQIHMVGYYIVSQI